MVIAIITIIIIIIIVVITILMSGNSVRKIFGMKGRVYWPDPRSRPLEDRLRHVHLST